MLYLLGIVASFVIVGSEASSGLDVVDLPVGFMPEGITRGEDWTVYVGHRLDGSIWMGDLTTGEGKVVVEAIGNGTLANGLEHDKRSGYLYVAGGDEGTARVYDSSFDLVADLDLAGGENSSFVNDIIITKNAAYITDSFNRNLYKIPLDEDTGAFIGPDIFETIQLSDNFPVEDGAWYANGIEETDDGMLIIANNAAAELYLVDPSTGEATLIDIGDEIINGDGLVLRKNTLWVVDIQNNNVREISLSSNMTCGDVRPGALTDELLNYPTTAVRRHNALYVVSAKFETAWEDIPNTPYEIVRVDRDSGGYACSA